MDELEGLKAVTINPAEVLGIDDRKGSLTAGKDADIVVWDQHPSPIRPMWSRYSCPERPCADSL